MIPLIVLLALLFLSLCVLLVGESRNSAVLIWLAKPIASTCFVTLAVANGALDSAYGLWILTALVLSWLGDLFLIPRSGRFFLAGLVSFLMAHGAFCFAFFELDLNYGALLIGAAAAGGVTVLIARWLMPHVEASLKYPVIAYIVVISLMVMLSVGAAFGSNRPLLILAAVIFYSSDLAVAREKFIAPSFLNRAWGLPLYYAAQALFALSV